MLLFFSVYDAGESSAEQPAAASSSSSQVMVVQQSSFADLSSETVAKGTEDDGETSCIGGGADLFLGEDDEDADDDGRFQD
jgi:hypothetical protein